jgi:hypothetical protein
MTVEIADREHPYVGERHRKSRPRAAAVTRAAKTGAKFSFLQSLDISENDEGISNCAEPNAGAPAQPPAGSPRGKPLGQSGLPSPPSSAIIASTARRASATTAPSLPRTTI